MTVLSRVGPAEIDAILPLMQEFYAIEHLPYDEQVARHALLQLWSDPTLGHAYLFEFAGAVAGYAVLTFGFSLKFRGRDALVDELYVRERYRGQGLGSACLSQIEEVCRGEGVQAVHLEVDHVNTRAQQLYHNAGYQDHQRHLLTKWLASRDECLPDK